MTNPRLYTGLVYHARHKPFVHEFRYRVFTFVMDWAERDRLARQCRLFSVNRFNLFSLNDKDHGPRDGSDVDAWIRGYAHESGLDMEGARIIFQGFPRVLGYVFNPLSLFYLYHRDGHLMAVLHQVKNTFGGQHGYLLKVKGENAPIKQETDKIFYVSPFIDMDCRYRFTLTPPDGNTFFTAIHQDEGESKVLTATWTGENAMTITDKTLSTVFVTIPLMTIKVIMGIHWQALRLVLKGAKYRSPTLEPSQPVTWK